MQLATYANYKASGISWAGDVPNHWDVRRGKSLFRKLNRDFPSEAPIVTCFRDGLVTRRDRRRTAGFTNALQEIGYQGVQEGDLVIHAMDAFAGASGVSDSNGKCSPVYAVCESLGFANPHYYALCVRLMAHSGWILALAKGIRERSTDFRFEEFGRQPLPVPPPEEQVAIVRYLDYMDRRVRRYIAAKQRLIRLLEEQKQAIIQQAVTRGLDPNVRLKPSGVEWLGDIPEHWEVRKLQHSGTILGGMTPSMDRREYWGGDVPWVTPKDMKKAVLTDTLVRAHEKALDETSLSLLPSPAVLLVVRGMILAKRVPIAVTARAMSINQDMKAIVPKKDTSAEFLGLVLTAMNDGLLALVDEAGHGTKRLPTERWRELSIPLPPLDEQGFIVASVQDCVDEIEQAENAAHREIELMREYRTSLISSVVTGKLDVRNVALPYEANDEDVGDLQIEDEELDDLSEELSEEEEAVAL